MVVDHYRVDHIYFIPLGKGNWIATARECFRCGGEFHCNVRDYERMVDESTARYLGVERLLRLTNPELHEYLDDDRQDEDIPEDSPRQVRDTSLGPEPAPPPSKIPDLPRRPALDNTDSERQATAIRQLAPFADFDRQAVVLTRELREFPKMPPAERDILFDRVEEYLARRKRLDAVLALTRDIAGTRPRTGVLAIGLALCLAISTAGVTLAALNWAFPSVVGSSLAAAVIGVLIGGWSDAGRQRKWFRGTYIPAVEAAGLEPADALRALELVQKDPQEQPAATKALARQTATLRLVLETDGKWPPATIGSR